MFEFYVAFCDALWKLALALGIILVLSLLGGVMAQARYQQRRKYAREQGGGDPWAL